MQGFAQATNVDSLKDSGINILGMKPGERLLEVLPTKGVQVEHHSDGSTFIQQGSTSVVVRLNAKKQIVAMEILSGNVCFKNKEFFGMTTSFQEARTAAKQVPGTVFSGDENQFSLQLGSQLLLVRRAFGKGPNYCDNDRISSIMLK